MEVITMQLTEQETNVIKDLQTQEKACVDKYRFYEQSAHDEELKNLFHRIGDEEQEHFDSLGMVLKGDVPNVSAARSGMEGYTPSESYAAGNNSEEKKHDQFLCTDCIATEKLVSSTYNDDVFRFSASNIRRLLNHIQTEEQNHAEMIYKYKTANNMA
jgi:rubrerythrin